MAHRTKHRRDMAAAELQTRTQPTLKKHPKQALITTAIAIVEDPDPAIPSKPFDMPRIAISQKPTNFSSTPTKVDTLLQAKALNKSADFESSKFSSCSATAKQGKGNQEVGKRGKKTKGDCAVKAKKLVAREWEDGDGGARAVEKERSKIKVSRDGIDMVKFSSLSVEEEEELRKCHEEAVDGARRNSTSSMVASGRRRRSFGGAQVELGDVFASSGVRVVAVDMPPFMQIHAVDCARKASDSLEKFSCKALAFTLKKEFDGVYGPAWHCIVGTSFGSFVTHSVGGFMYFSMDQKTYVLLFKTTVQRAD
ncbi:uncharacterized protein LOC115741447 [Rhodamnia argentea]|uniref:Uncharacterized protein LOC115741447 n=1 Tax=Rhodamnia argentea TaxID=178133 RepID=A0A8B8P935_9MYRT|nr:uncharacterized protein LOC115741447 [Rhodamnia argentea]